MKRFLSLALAAILAVGTFAADRISRNVNDLPEAGRTTLTRHFGKAKVNFIKIDDKLFGGPGYEVVLNNGTEVEFDSKGVLKEVESGRNGIPTSLLLQPIKDYINKNYKGAKVVEYKVEKDKYEVTLITGQELEFRRDGSFLRIDR